MSDAQRAMNGPISTHPSSLVAKPPTWVRAAVLVSLPVLLSLGCRPPAAPPPAGEPLVLIVVDTLRADHVTCYGYPRPTSPSVCALAADGVLFERAYTPRSGTTPAIASVLTGLYPHRHGVRDLWLVLPEMLTTLPELLTRQGYRTGAFVSSYVMVRDFNGFGRGFDVYDDLVARPEPYRENFERAAGDTVGLALAWLRSVGPRAFLFVHLIEPHGPYTPSPPFLNRFAQAPDPAEPPLNVFIEPYQRVPGLRFKSEFVGRYDGEIASADQQIGRLVAALRAQGWYRSATIVVMGDHGESMGEENRWFEHGRSIHDAEAQVPLVIKFAADSSTPAPHGHRVSTPVSLVDLFATFLREAGVDAAPSSPRHLRSLAEGARVDAPPPLTELLMDNRLTVAVHGDACSARWSISKDVLTDDWRLADTADAGRWSTIAQRTHEAPEGPDSECLGGLATAATPAIVDLLTFRRDFPVASRWNAQVAGAPSRFINQRRGSIIPLTEHERDALRHLGYLNDGER